MAKYYPHPAEVGDNDPYCKVLKVSLKGIMDRNRMANFRCVFYQREQFDKSALELFYQLQDSEEG